MGRTAVCRALAALAAALLLCCAAAVQAQAQEEEEILPEGAGRDVVAVICSGCHSLRLVAQQGMSERRWEKTLKWMVEEQGMVELDDETRKTVLGYLAAELGEGRARPGAASPFSGIQPLMPPPADQR